MNNRHVIWGTVTVVMMMLTALVILSLNDKSTADFLVVVTIAILPVLAGFGIQIKRSLEEVRDISNGNLNKERVMYDANLNRLLSMLAETHPSITNSLPTVQVALSDVRSDDAATSVYTRQ